MVSKYLCRLLAIFLCFSCIIFTYDMSNAGDKVVVIPLRSTSANASAHDHNDLYYTETEIDHKLGDFYTKGEMSDLLQKPAYGGNGEGVGGTICVAGQIEVFLYNPRHQPVDGRFSFIVPDFSYGQIRSNGSIRTSSGPLINVEHPGPGQYCLVFSTPPSGAARESTVISIHAER